jgi:hypothetical protein
MANIILLKKRADMASDERDQAGTGRSDLLQNGLYTVSRWWIRDRSITCFILILKRRSSEDLVLRNTRK